MKAYCDYQMSISKIQILQKDSKVEKIKKKLLQYSLEANCAGGQ
jgi:hypothetical protein